jgi:hypothetical protein
MPEIDFKTCAGDLLSISFLKIDLSSSAFFVSKQTRQIDKFMLIFKTYFYAILKNNKFCVYL